MAVNVSEDGISSSGGKVKYFLDTEFIEAGPKNPVTLISIGIVSEEGAEFYAVSCEFNPDDASNWVKKNVLPHLGDGPRFSLTEIATKIQALIGYDIPEFWGYYADYDWVVFAQIFGKMIDLPANWPMFCRDIKQIAVELGNPKLPKQLTTEHNALADAKWNKIAYEFLMAKTTEYLFIGKDSGVGMITDERLRQIMDEGFSPEHDDEHIKGELAAAAECYVAFATDQLAGANPGGGAPLQWPWSADWWKPSPDPIKNLKRGAALCAAEIDRLKRKG
jgi:hypothetical protein